MVKYIYQYEHWTDFTWQNAAISGLFGEVRLLQGKLLGQTQSLGFFLKEEKNLETLTLDVLKSSEIEREKLNYEQVRLSIARAISDMLLARSENSAERFYSLSNQIHTEKKQYYEVLQQSDAGGRSAHYQLCP